MRPFRAGVSVRSRAGPDHVLDGPGGGIKLAAWLVGLVSVAGFAAAWVLAARNRDLSDLTAYTGPDRFLVAYAVIGAVVASRRPSNPIGWLLLAIGLVTATRGLAGEYALHALVGSAHPAAAVWAAWYIHWSLSLLFPAGVLTFLLLLFPTGRPLTPRWRVVGWLALGLSALALLLIWFVPGTISLGSGLPSVPNPTGISKLTTLSRNTLASNGLWALGWLPLLLAAVSLFARFRRSADEERLQLKWFAYAAIVTLALVLPLAATTNTGRLGQVAFDAAVVGGLGLALPLAIGTAILKYRLYAIDRIISRVISYAIITAVLAGVFAGLVLLATDVLPVKTPVAVATATLAAAALFNPLRMRVQRTVDRRFNRSRYNAEAIVAAFTARLQLTVDLDIVQNDLLDAVQHAFEPAYASVWLAARDSAEPPGTVTNPARTDKRAT